MKSKNLYLANTFAEMFRKTFDSKTIEQHREFLLLLDNANKEAEKEKGTSDEFLKKLQKNKKQAENSQSTGSIDSKGKSEQLTNSQDLDSANTSTNSKGGKVAKPSRSRWGWIFGSMLMITSGVGFYLLLRNKNRFF